MNSTQLLVVFSFVALSGCIRTHGGDGGIGSVDPIGGRAGSGGAIGSGAGSSGSSSGRGGTGGSAGTAPSAGPAGTGSISGRGGTGGASGFGGLGVSGTQSEESCQERASRSGSLTQLSDKCFACTCGVRPSSTVACDRNCWRVIECVLTSGCSNNDVVCIQAACVGPLGGAERFSTAVGLAVAVPVSSCMAECFIPFGDPYDAGE